MPNLTDDVCEIKSPFDKNYNCIAFAAGDNQNWWWPTEDDFWPTEPRALTFSAFIKAFETKGFVPCDDGLLEAGYDKIAIYGKDRGDGVAIPTHAAIQLADGKWASKLGKCEDIQHATLEAVNSPAYGAPVQFLKRAHDASIQNPNHKEDFTSLLNAAAQKREPKD